MATQQGRESAGRSIGAAAERMGLKAAELYEAVIELADEGLLTARCINAAAGILLSGLGLPRYYFRTISQTALRDVLRAIATNLAVDGEGNYALSTDAVYLRADVGDGQQVLVSTEDNLAAMESVAGEAVARTRWEYYFCEKTRCYTYIIKPGVCPSYDATEPPKSRFAFAGTRGRFSVPAETSRRYERFIEKHSVAVARLVEFTACRETGETRIMFHKTISHLYLPIIRRLLRECGLQLTRAYGEPYRDPYGGVAAVCSFYVRGSAEKALRERVRASLRDLFALPDNVFFQQYLNETFSFQEAVFAATLRTFIHQFVYRDLDTDRQIMASVRESDLKSALAKRIHDANRSEFTRRIITEVIRDNPAAIKELFALFCLRFDPAVKTRARDPDGVAERLSRLDHQLNVHLSHDVTAVEVLRFAARLVTHVLKTNFFKQEKRAFAYRLDSSVLDPLVYPANVHGLFFVIGHYSIGTHMRSDEIARGGLRLLRTNETNYETQLDEAPLLNYALGPQAQRMKHKDIAEGGAKGVIVPAPDHAADALQAVLDYADGILDLILPSKAVVDYLGHQEIIFFGPDEGTAHVMDDIAGLARVRGYPYWRTFTTGKSTGIPHDAYGITAGNRVFALLERGPDGTELQVQGQSIGVYREPDALARKLSEPIASSGMTTTGVMAAFRTLIERTGHREEEIPLMMTGGPDGDLGANQIQCYQGPICLIIDSGGVLFDPDGLDRDALLRLCVARHTSPRLNSADFPVDRLGRRGFVVRHTDTGVRLPDGTLVEDGAFFHRTFLFSPDAKAILEQARIGAFIPCGGFKDTVNLRNVDVFLDLFRDLHTIVEGANVFFDDAARDHIAATGRILQIKDSTANKGGVMSSSLAEVLAAFLLGEHYEAELVDNPKNRFRLAHELMDAIGTAVRAETGMLLDLYEQEKRSVPLWRLSIRTSEWLLRFQNALRPALPALIADNAPARAILAAYVPPVLTDIVGTENLLDILSRDNLRQYRDAILTKKIAALALYRYATCWQAFLKHFESQPDATIRALAKGADIPALRRDA